MTESERNLLLYRIRELDANEPTRKQRLRQAKELAAAYDLEAAVAIVDEVEQAMHPALSGGEGGGAFDPDAVRCAHYIGTIVELASATPNVPVLGSSLTDEDFRDLVNDPSGSSLLPDVPGLWSITLSYTVNPNQPAASAPFGVRCSLTLPVAPGLGLAGGSHVLVPETFALTTWVHQESHTFPFSAQDIADDNSFGLTFRQDSGGVLTIGWDLALVMLSSESG